MQGGDLVVGEGVADRQAYDIQLVGDRPGRARIHAVLLWSWNENDEDEEYSWMVRQACSTDACDAKAWSVLRIDLHARAQQLIQPFRCVTQWFR